jgi:hypothetical protein
MLIRVTATDIKNGKRHEPCFCPIALAIKRQARLSVYIGHINAYVGPGIYSLPPEATAFIRRFDLGKPVKPFLFNLILEGNDD